MKRLVLCIALVAAACAPWNQPINQPLDRANAGLVADENAGAGETWVGLAFSGGGMRASAFAYGMLQELQAQSSLTGSANGVLDSVRLVSGVSGGSVTAAQFGLYGPAGLTGYRERYLVTNAEKYMATSAFNPVTLAKGIQGGANGRATFGRYLDETLYHGATFGDLAKRSHIKTWINATDIANNTPFLFSPETFDALCSDLSKLPLSEAVSASAAFPIVFTPVVLETHPGDCHYREPDWLTAARYNPEATSTMRAYGAALESYARADDVKYVKLLDGGITDNFGTTGLALEWARAQAPYAPMTAEEAVRMKRMLFLVANAGVESEYDWTQKVPGPGGVGLGMSIATASMYAATRSGYDAMRGELRRWETDLIEWRCSLAPSEVRRLRGSLDGWDCRDIKVFVGEAGVANLPPALRDELNKVPTRLRLPADQVDVAIEAGRLATRATPEFNGFLASLEGNDVETRIQKGIEAGGRRIVPVN
jgi:NTE family protein